MLDPIPERLCLLSYNQRFIFDHFCWEDAKILEQSPGLEAAWVLRIQHFLHLKELFLCIITALKEDGG